MSARVLVPAAVLLVALVIALPLLVLVPGDAGASFTPSTIAVADIPADYLALYQQAADRYGLDWAVLAAVGKIECDHGRLQLPGCNPLGTVNGAGATGPMQFLGPTWRKGTPLGTVPQPGPATETVGEGYATDGDSDGLADVWNTADAIHAAARYLHSAGAPGDYRRALYAYNHASWYIEDVLTQAIEYRGALAAPIAGGAAGVVAWAMRYLGTPYVWGGNHGQSAQAMSTSRPVLQRAGDGRLGYFDCSSLVSWAYANATGIWVGDVTYEQWAYGTTNPGATRGTSIPPGGLQPGDLVFHHRLTHVGIYLGNDVFIHASHTGDNVKLSTFSTYGGFDGYVRYQQLATGDTA